MPLLRSRHLEARWAAYLYDRVGTEPAGRLADFDACGGPIRIATDGSTRGDAERGVGASGFAYYVNDVVWFADGIAEATSISTELWAVASALYDAPATRELHIVTDCKLVAELFAPTPRHYRMYEYGELAFRVDESKEWGGALMRIRDLMWRRPAEVRVEWVPAHLGDAGDLLNRAADHLSRRAQWQISEALGYEPGPFQCLVEEFAGELASDDATAAVA